MEHSMVVAVVMLARVDFQVQVAAEVLLLYF
jgi:hypothetical protein